MCGDKSKIKVHFLRANKKTQAIAINETQIWRKKTLKKYQNLKKTATGSGFFGTGSVNLYLIWFTVRTSITTSKSQKENRI